MVKQLFSENIWILLLTQYPFKDIKEKKKKKKDIKEEKYALSILFYQIVNKQGVSRMLFTLYLQWKHFIVENKIACRLKKIILVNFDFRKY